MYSKQCCELWLGEREINFHFKWNVQRSSQIANNKFMFSLGNSPDLQQNKFIETVHKRRELREIKQKSIKNRLGFKGHTIE